MKKTKRHIGIDLHQNSFTTCILQGDEEKIYTFPLQAGGLEQFIEMLRPDDKLAVEKRSFSSMVFIILLCVMPKSLKKAPTESFR